MSKRRPSKEVLRLANELVGTKISLIRMCELTAALLKEKHDGRVFILEKSVQETQGWKINASYEGDLKTVAVKALLPDGTPYVPRLVIQ